MKEKSATSFKFIIRRGWISLYFRQGAGVARGKFSDKSGGMKLRLEYIEQIHRGYVAIPIYSHL